MKKEVCSVDATDIFNTFLSYFSESANVEKWRSMDLRVFMHIGSWDDQKRLSATQFSKIFGMPKARDRFATALANHLQQNNFDGLLISWYYPGCHRVR
jgi:GH18 family chitinase